MNKETINEKFLDLIEGTLPEHERDELQKLIAADPDLLKSFQEYQRIMEQETLIQSHAWTPSRNFTSNIMEKIVLEESRTMSSMLIMRLSMLSKIVTKRSAVTALTLLLVVGVSTKIYLDAPPEMLYKDAVSTAAVFVPPSLPSAVSESEVTGNANMASKSKAPQILAKTTPQERKENLIEFDDRQVFGTSEGIITESRVAPLLNQSMKSGGFELVDSFNSTITNAESYNSYGENQRIWTAQEATSTFSIDVDTASYANTRRFLQLGQLPPSDAVRVEEFINYFDYNYPTQHERPFAVHYELAPSPLQPDRVLLKLGVKAKDIVQSETGWNLVFLIDTSGSMSDENKLPLVKKSLQLLTNKMRNNDKVAIVTYAGEAGVALQPTSGADKAAILAAIEKLGAGGSTNGSGGIVSAYEIAEKMKISGAVNRVVLATDGDFNVGITSQSELIKLIEEKRSSGITLTTLGFGTGNIHDGTMEQLADKGNGNYFYIDSFKEARKVLETDLAGNMEVVAKDVKIQVEFNPSQVAAYRLIGYENRKIANEDFKNDKVDAGEIGSGHTVTALYELIMKGSELEKSLKSDSRYQATKDVTATSNITEVGFVKLRFKAPEGSTSTEMSFPLDTAQQKKSSQEATPDFKFASAVAYFGEVLHGSKFADGIALNEVAQLAQGALGEDTFGYRREFVELVRNAASLKK